MFSTWPGAKACPFPPLTTREFQEAVLYAGLGLNVLVCAAAVLFNRHVSNRVTLTQQVTEKQMFWKNKNGNVGRVLLLRSTWEVGEKRGRRKMREDVLDEWKKFHS